MILTKRELAIIALLFLFGVVTLVLIDTRKMAKENREVITKQTQVMQMLADTIK